MPTARSLNRRVGHFDHDGAPRGRASTISAACDRVRKKTCASWCGHDESTSPTERVSIKTPPASRCVPRSSTPPVRDGVRCAERLGTRVVSRAGCVALLRSSKGNRSRPTIDGPRGPCRDHDGVVGRRDRERQLITAMFVARELLVRCAAMRRVRLDSARIAHSRYAVVAGRHHAVAESRTAPSAAARTVAVAAAAEDSDEPPARQRSHGTQQLFDCIRRMRVVDQHRRCAGDVAAHAFDASGHL